MRNIVIVLCLSLVACGIPIREEEKVFSRFKENVSDVFTLIYRAQFDYNSNFKEEQWRDCLDKCSKKLASESCYCDSSQGLEGDELIKRRKRARQEACSLISPKSLAVVLRDVRDEFEVLRRYEVLARSSEIALELQLRRWERALESMCTQEVLLEEWHFIANPSK